MVVAENVRRYGNLKSRLDNGLSEFLLDLGKKSAESKIAQGRLGMYVFLAIATGIGITGVGGLVYGLALHSLPLIGVMAIMVFVDISVVIVKLRSTTFHSITEDLLAMRDKIAR